MDGQIKNGFIDRCSALGSINDSLVIDKSTGREIDSMCQYSGKSTYNIIDCLTLTLHFL